MPGSDDQAIIPFPDGASDLVATSGLVTGNEGAVPPRALPATQLAKRSGGRPPRPGGATPQAETQRAYRARRKAAGKVLKLVNADAVADLATIDKLPEKFHNALSKLERREQEVAWLVSRNAYLEGELKRLTVGPPVPHVIFEAAPGVSEAEFFRDVSRMSALVERYGALMDDSGRPSARCVDAGLAIACNRCEPALEAKVECSARRDFR